MKGFEDIRESYSNHPIMIGDVESVSEIEDILGKWGQQYPLEVQKINQAGWA